MQTDADISTTLRILVCRMKHAAEASRLLRDTDPGRRHLLERCAAYQVAMEEIGHLATEKDPLQVRRASVVTMLASYRQRALAALTDDFDLLQPQELARARGFALVVDLLQRTLDEPIPDGHFRVQIDVTLRTLPVGMSDELKLEEARQAVIGRMPSASARVL